MTDLHQLLRQFTLRYRRALVTKTAILAVLSLGILAVLAGRLSALHASPAWGLWVVGGLAILAFGGLGWSLRRRWLSDRKTATHLDQALALEQRLITAAEFAKARETSALYPLLLDDIAQRYATRQVRLPRPFDRTAGVLAVLLLVLLLWPGAGAAPLRLAQIPNASRTPQPPQQEQQQDSSAQQNSAAGQTDQSQSSSGGSQSAPSQSGGNKQQDSASRSEQGGDGGQQSGQGSQGQDNTASPRAGEGTAGGKQESTGEEQRAAQQTGRATASQQQGDSTQRRAGEGGQQHAKEGTQPSSASSSSNAAQQQPSNGGSGQAPGNQEALKAQIQELLKEVSGELKQLQAQLASAKDQPKPEAGTSTDPNLYESPMPLDQAAGGALPIQLQTDTAQTKSQRPGSGAGQPSGDVLHAAPQTQADDAQLSSEPDEELPASSQPVPPEYRSVFDQLRNRSPQQDGTRP